MCSLLGTRKPGKCAAQGVNRGVNWGAVLKIKLEKLQGLLSQKNPVGEGQGQQRRAVLRYTGQKSKQAEAAGIIQDTVPT